MVIAEIGLNHNGSFGLAVDSVHAAIEAGCDAVKFQTFATEDFLRDKTLQLSYVSRGQQISESFYDLCKRLEFRSEWLVPLKELCDKERVQFISTPTSIKGIRDLVAVGCEYVKNGSDFLGHLGLLEEMARSGMHVIVSTGMANIDDIYAALEALNEARPERVTVLHCTSSYPTQPEHVNLRRMVSLRDTFGVDVGFSDHTVGAAAAIQAVTLGAKIIEKHFTMSHDLEGPDHWFSADPEEMRKLVDGIRAAEVRMGIGEILPAVSERSTMLEYRLWVVSEEDVEPGTLLADVKYSFQKISGGGRREIDKLIRPKDVARYECMKIRNPLKAGEPFLEDDFEP